MPEETQPTQQPQVTTGTQLHNWKKVSLTVLIILVVSGLIVAAYWFLVLNKNSDNPVLKVPVQVDTTKTSTESAKKNGNDVVRDDVWEALEQQPKVTVTINLNAPPIPTDKDEFPEYEKEIKIIQDRVLVLLKDEDFDLIYQWEIIPGFVGQITKNGLEDLKNSEDVASVILDRPSRIQLY